MESLLCPLVNVPTTFLTLALKLLGQQSIKSWEQEIKLC